MAWQPQKDVLEQLARLLKDSLNGMDHNARKNAELMLKQAKTSPDINNYLALIMSNREALNGLQLTDPDVNVVRSAAALMLKNNIKPSFKSLPDSGKDYIRSAVLQGLQDDTAQVRNNSGSVINEIVRHGGIMAWPQVLSELTALAENSNIPAHTQQGAMGALRKICEDNENALSQVYEGQRPLDFLLPKLLELTASTNSSVRAQTLAALNCFVLEQAPAVVSNMDNLLLRLFQLSSDENSEVRKYVVRTFIQIADVSPERVIPHMEGLVDYMISQQRSEEDPELALDAAEFWLCVGEDSNLVDSLGPYLAKIVPVLLASMVYDEENIIRLGTEEDDAHLEDKEEDIKPQFASGKGARSVAVNGDNSQTANANGSNNDRGANEDDDLEEGELSDDDDTDDDDGGDPEEAWNLRKCSAAALDVLSSVFHGPVFQVTLPYLMENLKHDQWPNREAAVLALGAIADGCMEAVEPHLPELTPYLISLLEDKQPVVRQITCWSLGRYSGWAAHLPPDGKQKYFEPIMDGILKRMLDNNKRVQEAAASAFAHLEEKAGNELERYCSVIVDRFVLCFGSYKDRNMFILYDCVQTLAEHVGGTLAQPQLVQTLMPALIERWAKVSDQSREMFPLLECLSYVATALNNAFAPFARPIFERCTRIIRQNLEDFMQSVNNPALDQPDKDFLVTSLDLLSAIIQCLDDQKSSDLVTSSQPNIFQLLGYCMKDENNDVRQSAYALLGDCAIYVFPHMQPFLPSILDILISQLELPQVLRGNDETAYSVINNACWSVGEIAMRQGEGMSPYIDRLLQKLAIILFNDKVPESLNENAAIALGRLGIGCADQLAPHLGTFAPYFVRAVRKIDWTDEKAHALTGFSKIILANPQAMESCLLEFFVELASAPTDFLAQTNPEGNARKEGFRAILVHYQNIIPEFGNFLSQMPPGTEQVLRQQYAL